MYSAPIYCMIMKHRSGGSISESTIPVAYRPHHKAWRRRYRLSRIKREANCAHPRVTLRDGLSFIFLTPYCNEQTLMHYGDDALNMHRFRLASITKGSY